jgi:hypothetical protein
LQSGGPATLILLDPSVDELMRVVGELCRRRPARTK